MFHHLSCSRQFIMLTNIQPISTNRIANHLVSLFYEFIHEVSGIKEDIIRNKVKQFAFDKVYTGVCILTDGRFLGNALDFSSFEIEHTVWHLHYVGHSCHTHVGIMLTEMKEKILKINIRKEI